MACAMSISFDQHQVGQTPSTPNSNRSHGLHPQLYQTPTSGPQSTHHPVQPQNSLSISLHEPILVSVCNFKEIFVTKKIMIMYK